VEHARVLELVKDGSGIDRIDCPHHATIFVKISDIKFLPFFPAPSFPWTASNWPVMTRVMRPRSALILVVAVATLFPPVIDRGLSAEPPADLPRYDLAITLDTNGHTVHLLEKVTWTNRHQRPAQELVFNVYPHFQPAKGDIPMLAKTVELLRQDPSAALDAVGRAGDVNSANCQGQPLATYYQQKPDTALVVTLPKPVGPGESVTVELDYTMNLPNKQGRWGYWDGVTFLNEWLPTLAYYDEAGWQPTVFVPWHQPFFKEAGIYTARITVPSGEKVAVSGPVRSVTPRADGWVDVETAPCPLRDFTLLSSARYQDHTVEVDGVTINVMAMPEHDWYAREMVRIASEAIPAYNRQFGPYPYKHLTVAESHFPWNGNQCGGLVMIDYRVFDMPQLAKGYVDYLLSHEILHQWWYNVVGVDGYRETWMDEGLATYFSHRFLDEKLGKNSSMLDWPTGLGWLPNIHRENYRYYARMGAIRRGEQVPAVAPTMDAFGNVVNLFSGAYDRGSKVVGMIESRLGAAATFDFFRMLYRKYYFRVMRVADFQRELETYTGQSWDAFFKEWVYGTGLTDWKVDDVKIENRLSSQTPNSANDKGQSYTVTVMLKQQAQIDEPTTVGFQFADGDNFPIRVPIVPQAGVIELDGPAGRVEALPDHRVRVTVDLPQKPVQIAVDPDQVIEDVDPSNNYWKPRSRWRWTPLYTQLEEADLMNDYDRWNFIVGPWVYASATQDPWFQRPDYLGVRAGAFRTQEFDGGIYTAFRSDYRDLVVGTDGLIDHWPFCRTQVGYVIEERVASPIGTSGPDNALRAVVYGRYIFQYSSSMYMNPMNYAEVFGTYQDNPLPDARNFEAGAVRPGRIVAGGLHYHLDYTTPYWDPEAGFRFDATYTGGTTEMTGDGNKALNKLESQFTYIATPPAGCGYFSDTRIVTRISLAGAFPDDGEQFALGGASLFRGFDLAQRQGNALWVGNLEWRLPVVRRVCWDAADHVVGLRNLWVAPFYDVGEIFVNNHSVDGVAQALGVGLRADVAWFSFIERTIVRFDVAKTVNESSPWQFWIGMEHAF
jgi:Peptidase family M1 domain